MKQQLKILGKAKSLMFSKEETKFHGKHYKTFNYFFNNGYHIGFQNDKYVWLELTK